MPGYLPDAYLSCWPEYVRREKQKKWKKQRKRTKPVQLTTSCAHAGSAENEEEKADVLALLRLSRCNSGNFAQRLVPMLSYRNTQSEWGEDENREQNLWLNPVKLKSLSFNGLYPATPELLGCLALLLVLLAVTEHLLCKAFQLLADHNSCIFLL